MTVDPGSRGWNEHRHRWDVPAGTIQTADLADGSVTTPKLANLAVTTPKITDGSVTTPKITVGATQAQLAAVQTLTAWSSTTVNTWLAVTPLTTPSVVCSGVLTRVEATFTLYHSVAGAGIYTALGMDGAFNVGAITFMNIPGALYALPVSWTVYLTPAAGNHTFGVWVNNATAGTVTLHNGAYGDLYVTEQRR